MKIFTFLLPAVIAAFTAVENGRVVKSPVAKGVRYNAAELAKDTSWRFSNDRHMEIITRKGKAHIVCHIDSLRDEQREACANTTVIFSDQITNEDTSLSPALTDDNCYVLDIDLPHAQFVQFLGRGNYFVEPGDTLEIFTTAELDSNDRPLYTTFRGNSESATINTLLPEIHKRLGINDSDYQEIRTAVEGGRESATALARKKSAEIERLLTDESVRNVLNQTPLSDKGKGIVMMSAIAKFVDGIEYIRMRYNEDEYIQETDSAGQTKRVKNPDFKALDTQEFYATLLKHKEIIYNNPLILCTADQWVFINRSIYGGLFNNFDFTYNANGEIIDHRRIDPFRMNGTLMADISHSQGFCSSLGYILQNITVGKQTATSAFNAIDRLLSEQITAISSKDVALGVIKKYRAAVGEFEGGKKETFEQNWTDEQRALWRKITEKYAGNLLYVDFWGMTCGPCRSGMLAMRSKVEALKDDSFRFLYVCDEKYSPRAEAEAWMSEQNIHGEHIYVTPQEWNQLMNMFNFTSIPHAVLAGKDASIIQNDFFISSYSADQLRQMINRF